MQAARDLDQLIAQRLEKVHLPRQGLTVVVVAESLALRRVHDANLQGVLRQVGGFVVEQDGVPASEPLHRSSMPRIGIRVFGYPTAAPDNIKTFNDFYRG